MKKSHKPSLQAALVIASAFTCSLPAQEAIEQIVVTGVPGGQPSNELAQSVTVVSGEELDRVRSTNLGETLESQLGMSASYFGTGASRPIIRGLAGARVRTMEDGVDSMDVSTVSVDHAVGIEPLVARQVEIFRGPTTLLYGSGAVGGVVNTVTNRIPEGLPDSGIDGGLELRGDTASDERTLAIALDGGRDSVAWHIDAADRETADYDIPGGDTLENSDLELTSFALGGSWFGDGGMFGLSVSGFDTQYGIPGHDHGTEEPHGEEVVRIDLEQTRIDLKGGWMLPAGGLESIRLRLGINDYRHVELEGGTIGTRFDNDAWEGRLEILHAPAGMWTGAFGLQLGAREFSAIGEEAFVPPVDTASYGLFLIERREAGPWDLAFGARMEKVSHDPLGATSVDDSALSLSAGAIRQLGGGRALALNLASAERVPMAEEYFSDGPHLASDAFEVGDPNLGTETSRHFDIALRKTGGEIGWSVTAFVTDYDDFVYLRDTGLIEGELPRFEFSQQDASFRGLEAEVLMPLAEPGPGELDLRIFADYVRAELDAGDNVPRIPPLRYGARLEYHTDRFVVGLAATEYDDQRDVAPFETATPGYTLVSADFEWSVFADDGRTLSVFARATNLLDEYARRHTSLVKDIAPLAGRNFSVGLRLDY